ncbi:MAG TPA: PilZ domain-containing protein [Terriglobales bacterium]|nr:PilZ domain-containing protein [Terriglobales bacterium]
MSLSSVQNPSNRKARGWQRRYERHRADFPVKASLLRDSGYVQLAGRCGDLGHGGMGVVLTGEVAKDEVLSVEFDLPTFSATLVVRAIVRYRKGLLHGLEFLGLSSQQQTAVDEYCATLPVA